MIRGRGGVLPRRTEAACPTAPTVCLALVAILLAACAGGPAPMPPEPAPPPSGAGWARDAVVYEVFVRSFQDADGDGIGDLAGLTSRLDYLNDGRPGEGRDLEVDALWLMPVFPSPSYHGYDVTDLRGIHPDLGELEDFDRLVAEAHRRGIRILLDLPLNHTSSEHPWFRRARAGLGSRHRSYYVWKPLEPSGWRQPWGGGPVWHDGGSGWYYGLFWSGMPDLNFRSPSVQREILGAATFWLERGVDGFRLDAVRYLVETGSGRGQADTEATHAFLRRFAARCRSIRPDCLLIGEAWADVATTATYYGRTGDELDAVFAFDRASAVLSALQHGSAEHLLAVLEEERELFPTGALVGSFLANHDQNRVASVLRAQPESVPAAAFLLLTLPGIPFLYYGEETGTLGAKPDPALRAPMCWADEPGGGFTRGRPWQGLPPEGRLRTVEDQQERPGSLLSRYRRWIRERHRRPALSRGDFHPLTAPEGVLAFARTLPGAPGALVIQNLTGRALPGFNLRGEPCDGEVIDLVVPALGPWESRLQELR